MSDAYERVKSGRLTFKGGALATRSKDIDKKKKKKKKNDKSSQDDVDVVSDDTDKPNVMEVAGETYTIDPMKKMKYEELFPVETRKFGYDPNAKAKSVEEALDDRVKKKADRYCK